MKNKYRYIILSLIMLCAIFSGCLPDGKMTATRRLNDALNVEYKFVSVDTYKNSDGFTGKEYKLIDENGLEFYYRSDYQIDFFIPLPEKIRGCNYYEAWFRAYAETPVMEALKSNSSLEVTDVKYHQYSWAINLSCYDDLEQAAASIYKALTVVEPCPIVRDKYPSLGFQMYSPKIEVERKYMYQGKEYCAYIAIFNFLCSGETPLTQTEILEKMRYNYVDKTRMHHIDEEIPPAALLKYPASIITSVFLNGIELPGEYNLTYDQITGDYLMSCLDPCMDFEGFPGTNRDKGSFAYLVELLGGAYQCDDWQASWTIGNDAWTAELNTITKKYPIRCMTK